MFQSLYALIWVFAVIFDKTANFFWLYTAMGYGTRALQLLQEYYEGATPCLLEKEKSEDITKAKVVEVSAVRKAFEPK